MISIHNLWSGKANVPDALRRSHDNARAEFVRASMQGGQIAKAAKRLAQLCLPHFEHEEQGVFPVLALLPHVEQGNLRPEMLSVMAHIDDFRAKRDAINYFHHSILAAIEELRQAGHREKNREFAEFANTLHVHEKLEDEVIYPTIILIGRFLEEKLAHWPSANGRSPTRPD